MEQIAIGRRRGTVGGENSEQWPKVLVRTAVQGTGRRSAWLE